MLKRTPNVIQVPHFCKAHAADLINVNPRSVKRWIDSGSISAHRVGNRRSWYISLPEVNRMRGIHALPPLTTEEALDELGFY